LLLGLLPRLQVPLLGFRLDRLVPAECLGVLCVREALIGTVALLCLLALLLLVLLITLIAHGWSFCRPRSPVAPPTADATGGTLWRPSVEGPPRREQTSPVRGDSGTL
jgi:hypothetical protein